MTLANPLAIIVGLWAVFSSLEARTFLVDFGLSNGTDGSITPSGTPVYGPGNGSSGVPDANGSYWNNVIGTGPAGGPATVDYTNLVDTTNASSPVGLHLGPGWKANGKLTGGLLQPTAARLGNFAIATATQDFFFVENTATLQVSGLDPGRLYNFRFFGTRAVNSVRRSTYTVSAGNGQFSTTLQTSGPGLGNGTGGADGNELYDGNNRTIASINGVQTDATGQISLAVSIAEGAYAYLGILEISEGEAVPPLVSRILRIDFGCNDGTNGSLTASPDSNGNYWNNLAGGSSVPAGTTLANLVTTSNVPTGMSLSLTTPWFTGGRLNGGLVAPTAARLGDLAISTASEDYFYTDGSGGSPRTIKLSGLAPGRVYSLRMFGSRAVNETRRTLYTASAANGIFSQVLQTSGAGLGNGTGGSDGTQPYDGNVRNVATIVGLRPDANGQISLGVTIAEGSIGYLGILEILEGVEAPVVRPPPLADTIARWAAQDTLDPVEPGGVLFVGSSSIRRWETLTRDLADYRIVQRGFGGSQFSDLIPNINRLVIPYRPSAIVVFEGSNDIRASGKTAGQVLADFKTFVNLARQQVPGVPVCFISITCCPSYFWIPGTDAERRNANALIKDYCNSDPNLKLFYFDTTALFDQLHDTNPAAWQKYFVDSTHLNRSGYAHWLSVVRPGLQAVLAPNKTFTPNPATLAPGEKLYFDFGPSDGPNGDPATSADERGNRWNNWHPTGGSGVINAGEHLANLIRSSGPDTGIRMTITGGFLCGGKAPGGGLFAPKTSYLGNLAVEQATQDYFTSTADDINNAIDDEAPGGFMLDGLNPGLSYEFRFFGSRGSNSTNITEYAVFGVNERRGTLLTGGEEVGSTGGNANDSEVVVLRGVKPDAFGQVFVDVTLMYGTSAHLNAMEVTAVAPSGALDYNSWRSRFFSPGEIGNAGMEAGIWGTDADPDGDGRSNLLEYACGGDPRTQDFQAQDFALETTGQGDVLTFTYRRNLAALDVQFQVESTQDLEDWDEVADTPVSSANGIEIRRATVSRAGLSQLWLRLRVELAP